MDKEDSRAAGCDCGCSAIGCAELNVSPWPPGTASKTTALFGLPGLLGIYALLRKAPRRLPLFAALWVVIATAVRKVVCCRCDYYGTECSTLMGKWTAMIFEKDEEHPLTTEAFYLDFALIGASVLFPLPQVKKMGSLYLLLYIASVLGSSLAVKQMACRYCPNTVCFMNPEFRSGK
jgi:hypothetical protein